MGVAGLLWRFLLAVQFYLILLYFLAQLDQLDGSLPIRLSPTPTKCGVHPFPGVQPVKGRGGCPSGDAEQRSERVEGIEAPVESKREFVEVGL